MKKVNKFRRRRRGTCTGTGSYILSRKWISFHTSPFLHTKRNIPIYCLRFPIIIKYKHSHGINNGPKNIFKWIKCKYMEKVNVIYRSSVKKKKSRRKEILFQRWLMICMKKLCYLCLLFGLRGQTIVIHF